MSSIHHPAFPGVARRPLSRRRAMKLAAAGTFGVALPLVANRVAAWAQESTPALKATEYPLVEIMAKDFSFAMPAEIPGGLTRFTLHNEGTFTHHVNFLRLGDEVTQADIDAALEEPEYVGLLALGEVYGGPNAAPAHGGAATAILDLPAGDYRAFCIVSSPEVSPHYHHGMISPLTVTPAPAARPAPAADQAITLENYTFVGLPGQAPAGPQIWGITNAGPEIHELVVFRLSPGVTFETAAAALGIVPQGTPAAAPPPGPPFLDVGGVTLMSPGVTNWAVLDLEPGDYFANCFVLSPDHDLAPHFTFGMIQPFTVA